MTFWSKIFAIFPAIHIGVILASLYNFVYRPGPFSFILIPISIYIFPLASFRVLNLLSPIKEGVTDILNDRFSPWWAGHQIQSLFVAIPSLESILRIIPGVFSIWLRAWGSKIGKNIYWTPGTIHYDRNLLRIGNNVVFGERSTTVCHVITPKEGKALLRIKCIEIEDRAFIGAGSVVSPGVIVESGVMVRAGTNVYPMRRVTATGEVKIED